jgi:DNA modification methylase
VTSTVTMHVGDVRDVMARLPDNGFDMLVTSPPFLALRSYLPADHPDKHREIGSEPTPAAFLDTMYGLTEDWGRLLPEWASICVELGDTMSGSGGAGGDYGEAGWREGQAKFRQTKHPRTEGRTAWEAAHPIGRESGTGTVIPTTGPGWPLAKSMCLLPHLYTIGLAYGHNPLTGQDTAGQWRIRNVITWARPNPPVGSLGKRNPAKRTGDYKFRPACSFITVACRGTGRYFDLDAVRTEQSEPNHAQVGLRRSLTGGDVSRTNGNGVSSQNPAGAPPLDWHTDGLDGDWLWKLATAPYKGAHYATYPLTLPRRLILAMCPLQVCRECGWPSERVTETGERVNVVGRVDQSVWNPDLSKKQDADHNGSRWDHLVRDGFVPGHSYTRETMSWTDCSHDAWRTGTVLDPFGGSGTTAVAAALEHRDATLIDLDPRNVDLVRRRLRDHCRILSEHRDGDTIVWTVEPAARTELDAIAAGQMELSL